MVKLLPLQCSISLPTSWQRRPRFQTTNFPPRNGPKKLTSLAAKNICFLMAPSFVRRYGQRLFFVTARCLVMVVTLSEVVSARNDNVTDSGILYDGHLKWNDYRYLEGLPLEQLLLLQRKVGELRNSFFFNATNEPKAETREMPEGDLTGKNDHHRHMFASPLKMQNTVDRRSSVEPWNTKPSKVQKIFQISITGLAFLAFAGYLLCMIVQAIKSKGTTYYHPTITGTATLASVIKKRKPFMRRKRDLTYITPLDAFDADQLHQMLVAFAEGYAKAPGS